MMDLAIRNATIVDGSGAPRFGGDVGVTDGAGRHVRHRNSGQITKVPDTER